MFAFPNDQSTDAIETDPVSTCFDYGRKYGSGLNLQSQMVAPWFASTLTVNGGKCNDPTQPCYTVAAPLRYTSPEDLIADMSVSPGSWFNVQFYRFVTGSYSSSHSSWDCSSPDWREHWVSRNELYCYDDFLRVMDAAQAAVASGVVLADPHSVAVAWGRAQGSPSPSAPPSYRPDGSLTQGSVAFVGDNVYNSTGAGQSIAGVPVRPGSSASFSWQVQNDGTLPDQIALSGQGRSTGFTIDFKNGSTDITGAVAAGTYTTSISPGASVTITLKITAASTAAIGVVKQELLTATSQDHVATDTVLASVTVVNPSPPFRPDGLLSLGGGSFVGDGVYGATGAGQTIDQVMVPRGGSATFSWQIQNDGS